MNADKFTTERLIAALRGLGIVADAVNWPDETAIKRAFRREVKRLHPDRNQSEDAAAAVRAVYESHQILVAAMRSPDWPPPFGPQIAYQKISDKAALAQVEFKRHESVFFGFHRNLIKKYCRRLGATRMDRLLHSARDPILRAVERHVRLQAPILSGTADYEAAAAFTARLRAWHTLPTLPAAGGLSARRAFYLYAKILRTSAWALEEAFATLIDRPVDGLWRHYLAEMETMRAELGPAPDALNGRALAAVLDGFSKDFLQALAASRRHRAVLALNDYLAVFPRGRGGNRRL